MHMRKKIIALGVGAVSAATMAFGTVAPATAAEVPPGSIVTQFCNTLPGQLTTLTNQAASALAALSAAQSSLGTKQAAMETALSDFVAAVVSHITTVNNGGNVQASGQVVDAKLAVFVDKVIAWDAAWTAENNAQRAAYLAGVNQSFVQGVLNGLPCA